MTGHEIAENLRNSKERWTTGALHKTDEEGNHYFLGLKCYEAGVSLERLDKPWNAAGDRWPVSKLYLLNDTLRSKERLIEVLENPTWHDHDFPVEKFIEYLKATS